jgi:hypothetical protein
MDNNKNVPTLLVKVTAEDRDSFYFDTKKLNCDSSVERCVPVVQQYIEKDLSNLPPASSG